MNPLLLAQIIGAFAGGGLGGNAAPQAGTQEPVAAGINPAVLAAVLAAAAQRPAEPAPDLRLPRAAAVIAAVVVVGFFAVLAGIISLLVIQADMAGSALAAFALLCVGFGVLASKFGTVVDFLFGSSWGSRQNDAWRPSEGYGGALADQAPLPLPAPDAPSGEPQAGETGRPDQQSPSIHGVVSPSTDPNTVSQRSDVPHDGRSAAIRYCNPGAQYPSADAAAFGQLGYGVIGGGHKIARFPHSVNGAAANLDLLRRRYVGMTIGEAGKKWTGANSFGVPGYPDAAMLTAETIDDPSLAIPFMQAIAKREAGKDYPMTEAEWRAAHAMFMVGSADAWLAKHVAAAIEPLNSRATGAALVALARKFIGRHYAHKLVPKDDATYSGPFDCAELATYVVYQATGRLYGCVDNGNIPSKADAYTGAWKRDAHSLGKIITVAEAARTPGAFVLRYPPSGGGMGHIAISAGDGTTIEAKSTVEGVVADKISGRRWDIGVLIPWIEYGAGGDVPVTGPTIVYAIGQPNMSADKVKAIQTALMSGGYSGYDPGAIDGEYGPRTAQAVAAFQVSRGLVEDGEVGPETAAALGVTL